MSGSWLLSAESTSEIIIIQLDYCEVKYLNSFNACGMFQYAKTMYNVYTSYTSGQKRYPTFDN